MGTILARSLSLDASRKQISENQDVSQVKKTSVEAFLDTSGCLPLSLCIPDSLVETPPPMDIVCIIDISRSMR
jgi:hypothetical protein